MTFLTNIEKTHPNLKKVIDSNLVRLESPAKNPYTNKLVSNKLIGIYCNQENRLKVLQIIDPKTWKDFK